MRVRAKLDVVEARCWLGNVDDMKLWVDSLGVPFPGGPDGENLVLYAPNGALTAYPKDFIVFIGGEFDEQGRVTEAVRCATATCVFFERVDLIEWEP